MTNEAYKDELNAAAERGAAKRAKLNTATFPEGKMSGHAPGEPLVTCPDCGVAAGVGHKASCTFEIKRKEWEGQRALDAALSPSPLHAMLDERGSRYGKFVDHAACTQELKASIYRRVMGKKLMPDQLEALEMIAHKIGRIVCGDPDYEDSWRDIAGYATLVADRLKGEER